MKVKLIAAILGVTLLLSLNLMAEVQYLNQLEFGIVEQSKNDVQIPPDSGTYLEFDKFNRGPFPHIRLEGEAQWESSHGMRYVLAPFRLEVSGRPPSDIIYRDQIFSQGQELKVKYQFDSYRLGYFYQWLIAQDQNLRLGVTGKVRVAKIELSQEQKRASYSNIGFVPLFYLAYQKYLSPSWWLNTDMDFAAAPQGRAFDFSLKVQNRLDEKSSWGGGLRSLEGGADNSKVVTWSWFNYLVFNYTILW